MIIYGSISRHWPCGHGGAKCQTNEDCNYTENLYCSQGKCVEKKTISIGMIVGGVIIFLFSMKEYDYESRYIYKLTGNSNIDFTKHKNTILALTKSKFDLNNDQLINAEDNAIINS